MRATRLAVVFLMVLCLGGRVFGQAKSSILEHLKVQNTTPHHLDPMKRTLVEPVMALFYADEIGLTEEQRNTIQRQLKEARTRFGVLERRLEAENKVLYGLIERADASEQAVVEQMDRVLAAEREIKVANLLSSWRVRQLLSVEQREKLMGLRIPPPPPPPPPPAPPGAPLPHRTAPVAPRQY